MKRESRKELKTQYVHGGTLHSLFVLALAVSLWIAGGSVASADPQPKSVDDNQTIRENTTADVLYYSLDKPGGEKGTGVTFTVAKDGFVRRIISGQSGNKVIVERDGTISPYDEQYITAGVSNNVIIFKGTQNICEKYYNFAPLCGGYRTTTDKKIENNEVTIDGGTVNGAVYGGMIFPISDMGTVTNNIVTVKNKSTVTGIICGGQSANAQENKVYIMNQRDVGVGNVYGGESRVVTHSDVGTAQSNWVTISDSTVNGTVYGGYAQAGTAIGNTVTISRSPVEGDIYGGKSSEGTGNATKNIVTLTDVTVTKTVYGGGFDSDGGKDYVSGNTLNLSGANKVGKDGNGMIKNFETINILSAAWGKPVLSLKGTGIQANEKGTKAAIDASKLAFSNPEAVVTGTSMKLIDGNIDAVLASAVVPTQSYTVTPVTGVTINAALNGSLALSNTALTYTATNKASGLTFGDVEWKDSGSLLDHTTTLSNVSFDGADVDTTNINFTNIRRLAAGKKMTLVSNFGDTVGTNTGSKYKVGSTLEGTGKASLVGNDLIFTAETSVIQEQTHNTVMGAEVGMAALAAGNDFIGAATEGLAAPANVGADGVSSFAQMGGGSMRQETGSHVDTHTWNAVLAIGHQNKKEKSTTEYGAFFEYGSGNYTTFNGDERGDGSMHYTGGGLLAKWQKPDGLYVEGSLRAGSVHDDAQNVLRDDFGIPYSYETNAPYFGAHIGVGKEIALANGNTVDVYGKYFYNRRNGVSFDAGGHYDLDAVTSQVIRVGARYTVKRDKWNYYAGVAYEHELDGKAAGTAEGVAIRGADIGGGSFRGELGATVQPDKNVPVTLDLNLTGFAGQKQGFTGGISITLMF